jgi:hypothetical protein
MASFVNITVDGGAIPIPILQRDFGVKIYSLLFVRFFRIWSRVKAKTLASLKNYY